MLQPYFWTLHCASLTPSDRTENARRDLSPNEGWPRRKRGKPSRVIPLFFLSALSSPSCCKRPPAASASVVHVDVAPGDGCLERGCSGEVAGRGRKEPTLDGE